MPKDYVINDSVAWRRKCALETMTPLDYSRAKHLAFQRAHEDALAEDWREERLVRDLTETARDVAETRAELEAVKAQLREASEEQGSGVRARKVAP